MKPLFPIVVAILVIAANAHPDNIEAVKELPQTKETVLEAEESEPQARKERCTACSGQTDILAAIRNLPKGEVHTQQSFEGCSSKDGCAGIKVKDGQVLEKYGNLEAFKAAAAANAGNEFQFHEAGSSVFDAAGGGPFWWLNQNSPFKTGGATFEKFSKQTSSSFTSGSGADLAGNPFLNGDFSKLSGGFTSGGSSGYSGGSAFESGSKGLDISKNPFLTGGVQSGYSGSSQSSFNSFSSGGKFGGGYTGSSPTPFTASTPGANINLIQNTQKASEFDYQQQSSIDDIFQNSGNVQANENSGGDFQQTCSGQGYVCVPRAQCNNGVVNANGGALLQANTQKQYCNVRSEICCRIETSSLAGAGSLQGSLGVGSATFSSQGSNLFSGSTTPSFGSGYSSQTTGSGFTNKGFGATGFASTFKGSNAGASFGSPLTPPRFGTTQSNFIETDSFSAGSDAAGVFRPGASGLKPGVPYLPPVDSYPGGSSVVSTGIPSTFVTTPRPFSTPRPVTTPRPFSTVKPTYLPPVPSTSAPEYLPPIDTITAQESRPEYTKGGLLLEETLPQPPRFSPPGPSPSEIPAGCAAALKCTPIEFCTAEGVMSNTSVILTREQEAYRVPLTDCKDLETGRIGKCCRDPFYTDPWPTNQLGKWVPGVFGGNDGKYIPDSKVSSNNPRPQVTLRPDTTGSVIRNNFLPPTTPTVPFGPSTITPGFPNTTPGSFIQQNQYGKGSYEQGGRGTIEVGGQGQVPVVGQGQYGQGNQGQYAQGSQFSQTTSQFGQGQTGGSKGIGQTQGVGTYTQGGRGQITSFGQGQTVSQGQGTLVTQGVGTRVTQGTGQIIRQGGGQISTQGGGKVFTQGGGFETSRGQTVTQGGGVRVITGQGQGVTQGVGQGVVQGFGETVTQGQGSGVRQGVGFGVTQGQGFGVSRGQGAFVTQGTGVTGGTGQVVSQGAGFGVSKEQGAIVSQGQGQIVSQGQGFGVITGQGQGVRQGVGVITGQGQGVSQGQGFGVTQGQGFGVTQGQGFGVTQGQGFGVSQGQGFGVSQGQGQGVRQGVGVITGQGQGVSQGQGFGVLTGQGQGISQGQGFGISQGQGQGVRQGQGVGVITGQGQGVSQGFGFGVSGGQGAIIRQGQGISGGQGQIVSQGQGVGINQGFGYGVSQGQGQGIIRGTGQTLIQGQGQKLTQGFGTGVKTGGGYSIIQGDGAGVENDYSESVRRVFLQRYTGSGQCGILNPQNPLGNHKDLEVDFAEIPWQAMVLLQTNKSLLCGGVITRPDVVVTTASCVEGLQAKNVLIKGGEWKLGIDDEPLPFQIVQVKHILRHPFYKAGSYKYDAAILVLTENLRLAKNIWPICLPSASDTLDAYYNGAGECILTGWGKQVLQAHLSGSIMHSLNISLINPGECEAKISQDYPHLLEQYDQDSCVCGQPTNPLNNLCRVDIGSALACTTGDSHFVLRGVYSWDSGCQVGNQLAAFYKFDLEWYEWAIGLSQSVRFAKYEKVTTSKVSSVKTTTFTGGIKGSVTSGVKGFPEGFGIKGLGQTGQFTDLKELTKGFGLEGQSQIGQFDLKGFKSTNEFGLKGQSQSGQFNKNDFSIKGVGQTGQFTDLKELTKGFGLEGQSQTGQFDLKGFKTNEFGLKSQGQTGQFGKFGATQTGEIQGPISKTFSATFTEKKFFQSEPKIVTYTTKPEIVTFTTKPEYFTYTTKPEIVTFTTKPEIVTYTTKPEIVTYTTKPEIVTYTTKPEIVTYTTKPEIFTYTTKPKIFTYTTKPKIVTYTTKPQIIRYETSGTKTNPTYAAPEVSFNPSFSEVVGAKHTHTAACKCLENGQK